MFVPSPGSILRIISSDRLSGSKPVLRYPLPCERRRQLHVICASTALGVPGRWPLRRSLGNSTFLHFLSLVGKPRVLAQTGSDPSLRRVNILPFAHGPLVQTRGWLSGGGLCLAPRDGRSACACDNSLCGQLGSPRADRGQAHPALFALDGACVFPEDCSSDWHVFPATSHRAFLTSFSRAFLLDARPRRDSRGTRAGVGRSEALESSKQQAGRIGSHLLSLQARLPHASP